MVGRGQMSDENSEAFLPERSSEAIVTIRRSAERTGTDNAEGDQLTDVLR